MTPTELKEARLTLGLTLEQMATMLRYKGSGRRQQMWNLENGLRTLGDERAELVKVYLSGYRPDDWPIL